MPVTPDDFLQLGKSVVEKDDCSEVELRNAYRCTYYAVHHAARLAVPRMGLAMLKAKNGGAHADVEVSLREAGTQEANELVAQMQRLKRFRVDCDYHLDKVINRGLYSLRIADAEATFQGLVELGCTELRLSAE